MANDDISIGINYKETGGDEAKQKLLDIVKGTDDLTEATTRNTTATNDYVNSMSRMTSVTGKGGLSPSLMTGTANKSGGYSVEDETRAQELLAAKTAAIAIVYDQELKTKQAILETTNAQAQAELRAHAALLQEGRLANIVADAKQRTLAMMGGGAAGGGGGGSIGTNYGPYFEPGGPPAGGPGGFGTAGDPYSAATKEIKSMQDVSTAATTSMSKGLKGIGTDARDFGIIVRSAGSIVAPQYAGYLYYFSQIERNLKGAALAAGGAALAVAAVVAGIGTLISAGAKIDGINQAFDNMTKSAGVSGDELIAAMQKVSMGTLSAADSMKMANIAMMSVGTSMANDLPRLLEIARASSIATGQDISYTFQSLITGIARGSPKLIDNANIYLKLGDANAAYAASLGKSVSELSAQEKQVATLNAVLAQGGDLTTRVGVTSATAQEKIVSLGVAFTDLKNSVGLYLATLPVSVPGYMAGLGKNIDLQMANAAAQKQITAEQQKTADQDALIADKRKTVASGDLAVFDAEAVRLRAYRDELLKTNDANKTNLSWQGAVPQTQASVIALQQQYNSIYGDTVKGYSAAYDAQQKLLGLPTTAELVAQAAAAEKLIVPLSAAAQAYAAYFEALTAVQTSPAQNFGADLAKDVTKLRDLIGNFPKMPSIGGSLLTTDMDQMKAWALVAETYIAQRYEMRNLPEAAIASVFPSKDRPTSVVNDAEQAQRALADSLSIVTVANKTFVQSNEGVVGSIADTVKDWDKYGAAVQKTLIQLGIVPSMLADIQKNRNLPITPADLESGITDAIKSLDSLAGKYDKVGLARQASEIRGPVADSLVAGVQANWQNLLKLDSAGWADWIAQRTQGLSDLVDVTVAKRQALLDAQKDIVNLQQNVLAKPKLGDTPMTTDLTGLDAYYTALGKLDPANADLALSIRGSIAALIQQRTESLATALAMDNPLEAMRQLAVNTLGAGTSVQEFVKKIAQIPGAVGGPANAIKLLGLAITDFLATTQAPVTLDVQMATIEEGTKSIASAAQGLLKNLNPDQALAFLRKANTSYAAEMLALGTRETAINKDEWDIRAKNTADYYTSAASEVGDFFTFQKQQSKDAATAIKKDLATQKTDIETAFNKGLVVTDTQMAQTAAGTYSNVALESVRQLDDIFQHGREAISRHKDWIAKFSIPAPMMAPNSDAEKQLKAWAGEQRDLVANLTHPNEINLIDWDAFVKSYQAGLDESATKLQVEEYAFNKLMEKGLIGPGGEEAARKKVEGMFGTPKVTMESYFKTPTTDDPTMQKFLDVLAGGKSVQVPATLVFDTTGVPAAKAPSTPSNASSYWNPETGQYQETPYTGSGKKSASQYPELFPSYPSAKAPPANAAVDAKSKLDELVQATVDGYKETLQEGGDQAQVLIAQYAPATIKIMQDQVRALQTDKSFEAWAKQNNVLEDIKQPDSLYNYFQAYLDKIMPSTLGSESPDLLAKDRAIYASGQRKDAFDPNAMHWPDTYKLPGNYEVSPVGGTPWNKDMFDAMAADALKKAMGETTGAQLPFDVSKMQAALTAATAKADFTVPGQTMYSSTMDSFYKSFDGATIGASVGSKLLADFTANGGTFGNAGAYVGGQVLAGVVSACQAGSKDIIDAIAGSVAPSVGKILSRNGPQRPLDNSCW